MAASHNIIFVDPEMLNPILWSTLPREMLLLVLARMPLSDITRLRSLSRDWRSELAIVNSDINQACDEVSSTMVALLSHTSIDAFFVTIYNITKSRWQCAYYLHLRRPAPLNSNDLKPCPRMWTPVDACDGGLMCFISLWKPTKDNWLSIAVVNLLTRVQHELPPLHYQYCNDLPTMVQIKVDSCTKCYKVVVLAYQASGFTVETYDSGTRQWSRAMPQSGSIYGPFFHWICMNGWFFKLPSSSPSAYDFGKGKLEFYTDFSPSVKDSILIDRALVNNRVFDLMEHMQMDTSLRRVLDHSFHIIEYHVDSRTNAWVKEKSYKCPAFEDLEVVERFSMRLNACDGFLMVIYHCSQRATSFRLLDLSTGEWNNVPKNPNSEGLLTTESKLCRAFWNVIP